VILRPYQAETLERLAGAMLAGQNRLLVKSPTGTGKTVTFAAMLQHAGLRAWLDCYPANERKMLVIAHREELLDQAAAKILAANPHLRVAVEQGERYATRTADVVVASIQTLQASGYRRLDRLMGHHRFRIVVVDEAHHAAADTYRTTLARLGFLPLAESNEAKSWGKNQKQMERDLREWDQVSSKDQVLVGVTATPNRSDAVGLTSVFQSIAFSYELRAAINDGWLVPIVPWVVETDLDLDDVKLVGQEFNQKDLAKAVNLERRNQLAVAAWEEYASDRSTIAFTVDVAHAHAIAAAFTAAGVEAAALSGETPKPERQQLLRAFSDGRLQLLSNCMVLTEGTDLPITGCILHCKPTRSASLYEQMTGRGLRLFEGKQDCIVIDVVDVTSKHSLATSPVLYGLPPGVMAQGRQLEDVARFIEDVMEEFPSLDIHSYGHITLDELRARVKTIDLWQLPDLGAHGQGLRLKWVRTGPEAFRLQYPWEDATETLIVGVDLLGRFEVATSYRQKLGNGTIETTANIIAAGMDSANEALRSAERFMINHRTSVFRMKDSSASWRNKPASEKQIQLLRNMRAPIREKLTAGEASDFIDARRLVNKRRKAEGR